MKLSSGIVSQEIHEAEITQSANVKAIYFKRYGVLWLFILIGSDLIFVLVFLRFNLFELTHEPESLQHADIEGVLVSVPQVGTHGRVGFSELLPWGCANRRRLILARHTRTIDVMRCARRF